MKTLTLVLAIMISSSTFTAPESACKVVAQLEAAGVMNLERAEGKIQLDFNTLSKSKTKIVVIDDAKDPEAKAMFGGEFAFSNKTILNKKYCSLKRTLEGEVINSMVLIQDQDDSNLIRLYLGLGSDQLTTEAIESDEFFILKLKK